MLIGLYHASSMSKIASKSSPARKSQSSAIFDLKSCAGSVSRDGTVQHQIKTIGRSSEVCRPS